MKKESRQQNIQPLEEAVRKAGFPERVLPEVRKAIQQATGIYCDASFSLRMHHDRVKGHLHFERDGDDEPFQLTYFYLDLGPRLNTHFHDGVFFLGQGFDLTLRKAYNLICGRAIFRRFAEDPAGIGSWIFLDRTVSDDDDLRFFIQPYGFCFSTAFSKAGLPAYLGPLQLEELERSLKEGNRQVLDLVVEGVATRVWVEVGEGHQSIWVVDEEGERISIAQEY